MLDGSTRTIQADREEILGALRESREKHITEYRDAVKGWFDIALGQAEALVDEVAKARDVAGPVLSEIEGLAEITPPRRLHLRCANDFPPFYLKEYDRAIKMLELHKESRIELTAQDVERYVMDNWSWTENFKNISATYSSGR